MRAGVFLAALLALAAAPAAARECANFYGAKCEVKLATGVVMTYVDQGPRNGTPLVLLHGYTDSSLEWVTTVQALAKLDPGLRLIAIDQRGAGGTGLPPGRECEIRPAACTTNKAHAEDVVAFIQALHLRRPVLVGHSMGSYVARAVALAHPELVNSLVLIGTGAPLAGGKVGLAGLPGWPAIAGGEGPLDPGHWRAVVESRGLVWPRDAYALRPLDLDSEAVQAIAAHWDVSALAPPEFSKAIAAQTALVPLAFWGIDPAPVDGPAEDITTLSVSGLILWGIQDGIMTGQAQDALLQALMTAVGRSPGVSWVWKIYGERKPDPAGGQTDIGHELVWEAPVELARDIVSYIRTGMPTPDLFRAEGGRVVTVPGKAVERIINSSSFPSKGNDRKIGEPIENKP